METNNRIIIKNGNSTSDRTFIATGVPQNWYLHGHPHNDEFTKEHFEQDMKKVCRKIK